jgi:hypothetical protein
MTSPTIQTKSVSLALGVGVFFIPYIFVWVLFAKGYSKIARYVGVGYLVFLLTVLIVVTKTGAERTTPPIDVLTQKTEPHLNTWIQLLPPPATVTFTEQLSQQEEAKTEKAKNKQRDCLAKIKKAKEMGLITNFELRNSDFFIAVNERFFKQIDFETKTGLAENLNCAIVQGTSYKINFEIRSNLTNEVVAEYAMGKLKYIN